MSGSLPDEGLVEAARLAREQAPTLCYTAPGASGSCAWHHGLWPTLRQLGLASEPALHGSFLRGALAAVDGAQPRILLSGAADQALLALALGAFAGREPEITVLDVCETPLMLNRWYAERAGLKIHTARCDILEFKPSAPFDAVCTHAFLGNFDPPRRSALAAAWHALLRPGGRVVTVNRLRPGREPQWVGFSVDQIWAYRSRVEEAAKTTPVDFPGLGRAAEKYADRQAVFPLGSARELRELFEGACFAIEQLTVGPIENSPQPGFSVPTMPGGDDYARLIAIRR
ncbi:MAG: methyltransferase domain-containing protein [Burkholderiales bacterium]